MTKKCIHCGAELPKDASFCPQCAKEQGEKQVLMPPKPKRKLWWLLAVAAVCLCVVAVMVLSGNRETVPDSTASTAADVPTPSPSATPVPTPEATPVMALPPSESPSPTPIPTPTPTPTPAPTPTPTPEPTSSVQPGSNTAEVIYTDEDGEYLIYVTMNNGKNNGGGQDHALVEIKSGYKTNVPARLYVLDKSTGTYMGEEFLTKIASFQLSRSAADGSIPEVTPPELLPSKNDALHIEGTMMQSVSPVTYLVWELTMVTGESFQLRQTIEVMEEQSYAYSWEDYPMNTDAELQAVLDLIVKEVPLGSEVEIHLPPVTYTQSFTFSDYSFTIYGSNRGGQTVFTDTIYFAPGDIFHEIFFLAFPGSGGIAIQTESFLQVRQSSFTGWDTGILAQNGGWIHATHCYFGDNGVGVHFNSSTTKRTGTNFESDTFENNDTAFYAENIPGGLALSFPHSQFKGNDVDIDNPRGYEMDISESVFEE